VTVASGRPWAPGAATGIGSLPGTDPDEAVRVVFGELPELPHLPELPARGVGADMIGRSAALLVDLPVEVAPTGWRMTARPGRDLRRARDLLARDLDALAVVAGDYTGPLKVQVAGPWTLAAAVELASGHRVLTDHGAARDLAASLAEGVRQHLAEVAIRVPGAVPVVQLDEPSLPAALAGSLPTASSYGTVRAVDAVVAEQALGAVVTAAPAGSRVVHCCAASVPWSLLRGAGVDAVSVDAELLTVSDYDAVGEAVEAGVTLWLGVVPALGAPVSLDRARDRITGLWRELGFAPGRAASSLVATPSCGLAGADPARIRQVLRTVRDVGRSLLDLQD
jgi:methionine synthase II (cobalamin-independent)